MTETENPKNEKRNRCTKCNSTFGYLRVKTKQWVCRSCGYTGKLKEDTD